MSRYLLRRFGLEYDPETEILITIGGSEALDSALRVLLEPEDGVLIPEPCFVAYKPLADHGRRPRAAGAHLCRAAVPGTA